MRERARLQAEAARIAQHTPAGNAGPFQRRRRPAPPGSTTACGYDDKHQLRLLLPGRITYVWCVAFYPAPLDVRAEVSQARRSQYRRIARLPPYLGENSTRPTSRSMRCASPYGVPGGDEQLLVPGDVTRIEPGAEWRQQLCQKRALRSSAMAGAFGRAAAAAASC
ncbi:hypothetical protein WMF04_36480 [Sorangium sp. So ce260]|uniref:hypothetical protein n=1 Tax=Sorangium sp. So ce260 TaxID=3133291 RepID=UPI003F5EDF5A